MQIPPHYRETAERYGLRRWVDERRFPRDDWYGVIDDARGLLKRRSPDPSDGDTDEDDQEPSERRIAGVIAECLFNEGALATKVIATRQGPAEADWPDIALAAGYVLLQRYKRAVRNGEWPKND